MSSFAFTFDEKEKTASFLREKNHVVRASRRGKGENWRREMVQDFNKNIGLLPPKTNERPFFKGTVLKGKTGLATINFQVIVVPFSGGVVFVPGSKTASILGISHLSFQESSVFKVRRGRCV